MKESEALKKWCPQSRNNGGGTTYNRRDGSDKCIGSGCMMWEPEYRSERDEIDISQSWKLGQTRAGIDEHVPDGWHLGSIDYVAKKILVIRYYPIDEGDCGLKTKEASCNYG